MAAGFRLSHTAPRASGLSGYQQLASAGVPPATGAGPSPEATTDPCVRPALGVREDCSPVGHVACFGAGALSLSCGFW